MQIHYRPAVPEDEAFLYTLHRAAMRAAVEDAYGPWNEDWQRAYYHKHFNASELSVIQVEGQDVGVLHVQQRAEELFLANIEILPEFQGRGIGTVVLRELIEQAARAGKPVALQVLKGNIRARSLYQRLGFGVTGENETHYILAREVPPRRA